MRIKLDENLPGLLAIRLGDLGHEVDTVADDGLVGSDDEACGMLFKLPGAFLSHRTWVFQTPGNIRQEVISGS
jgi:hypothetical protein